MVLSDTGFWYAFFNSKDKFHAHSLAVMQRLDKGLITTWPVITETCYLLGKALGSKSHTVFYGRLMLAMLKYFKSIRNICRIFNG
jgi:predicted nucleic acid-binding protein